MNVTPQLAQQGTWASRAVALGHGPNAAERAPVRVGVVVNPRARAVRQGGERLRRELIAVAGEPALVAETHDVASLRVGLSRLVRQERVNVLAVAGGDGTLHFVANELVRAGRETGGDPFAKPALLVLRGGTLNIVGTSLGTTNRAEATLARFVRRHRGAPLAEVTRRALPMLEVRRTSGTTRVGFVFGSEMVSHALELYERFGGGYGGLTKFLFETARGCALKTELWRAEGWRLTPPETPVAIVGRDGTTTRAYAAAVASTVDLTIGGGRVRALRRAPDADGFFAKVITETRTSALVRMIPALMREAKLASVHDEPEAEAMHLRGGYTLDGERFASEDDGDYVVARSRETLSAAMVDD